MNYDWFNSQKHVFEKILLPLNGKEIKALQIGAYTGDATIWLLDNVLTNPNSVLYDVDDWIGTDEYEGLNLNFSEVEKEYDRRTKNYTQIVKNKTTSDNFFAKNDQIFDLIYIDGCHYAEFVARDAENSLKFSKSGTIIAFDDYGYFNMETEEQRPKIAIDNFLEKYADRIEILEKQYQVWVKIK
jgi:predicted O-methyltransferase YrrM